MFETKNSLKRRLHRLILVCRGLLVCVIFLYQYFQPTQFLTKIRTHVLFLVAVLKLQQILFEFEIEHVKSIKHIDWE